LHEHDEGACIKTSSTNSSYGSPDYKHAGRDGRRAEHRAQEGKAVGNQKHALDGEKLVRLAISKQKDGRSAGVSDKLDGYALRFDIQELE